MSFFIGTVLTASFFIALFGLWGLNSLRELRSDNVLKKYLFVSSGKSLTDAILLGGLPIALAVGLSIFVVDFYFDILQISFIQKNILIRGLISAAVLVSYGYLDDKYELRPVAKLVFQSLTILMFTLSTTALLTSSHYSNIVFFLYSVAGMALINGNNLLDGLDTLAIKTNIISLGGFAFMGYYTQSPLVMTLAFSGIGALCAFYFFNKSPAKIYLGEIGGTFLGFTYLIMMALYQHHQIHTTNTVKLLFYSALPVTLPIMELFISFSRRVFNNKSPFKGDRLHLHYILTQNHDLSIPMATNVYALFNLIAVTASLTAYYYFQTSISLIIASAFIFWTAINHFICHNYWTVSLDLSSPLHTIFNKIRKKDVTLIDVSSVDTFEFKLVNKTEENKSDKEKDKQAA